MMKSESEAVRVREEIKRDLEETRMERDRQKEEVTKKDKVIIECKALIESQEKLIKEA